MISIVFCDQHGPEARARSFFTILATLWSSHQSGRIIDYAQSRSSPGAAVQTIRWCRFPLQVNNMGWGGGDIDLPWYRLTWNEYIMIYAGVDIAHYNLLSLYCRRVLKRTLIWIKLFIFHVRVLVSHIQRNNLVINIAAESTNYSEMIENGLVGISCAIMACFGVITDG